ncbi:hypothetical protein F3S47_18925 [Histidinibacterium aquaticum]|uniref:Uncharacterized protein n=1 Tax=Histidinibacterium aquaticum TaxID=2613962 RepID=A0A5J5GAH5_9RHOB|nr:hypothetical protein F3S47_18925 [Histidinibacterium aquaticum]
MSGAGDRPSLPNDSASPFHYFRTRPEIIRLSVMLYVRFAPGKSCLLSRELHRAPSFFAPPQARASLARRGSSRSRRRPSDRRCRGVSPQMRWSVSPRPIRWARSCA